MAKDPKHFVQGLIKGAKLCLNPSLAGEVSWLAVEVHSQCQK